ncbi:MAG: phosphoribosyltransferase-like protein [Armatimonadota bacterium]
MVVVDSTVETIVNNCIERWGQDSRTDNFFQKVTSWLEQIDDNRIKEILLILLSNFNYYNKDVSHRYVIDSINSLIKDDEIRQYSIATAIKSDDGRVNSSFDYIFVIKNSTFMIDGSVIDDIISFKDKEEWEFINHIILVDDICGSGRTITKYLNRFVEGLPGKVVHYIVIEISEEAYSEILEYAKENDFIINITYRNCYKKAFYPGYIFKESDASIRYDILLPLESSLWKKSKMKEYVMGFRNSQALVAFSANTPNNTISCFWRVAPNNGWIPIFPRKILEKSGWRQMGEKKRKISRAAYNITVAERKNNGQY